MRKSRIEGAVSKSRIKRSSEEEQEWKEQWGRAGMGGAGAIAVKFREQ